MVILPQNVEVCIYNKTKILNEYKEKGYECELGVPFMVRFEDLRPQQNVKIKVSCDYCGKEFYMTNGHYRKDVVDGKIKKVACKNCGSKKIVESNLAIYGVTSAAKLKEIKEKQINTSLKKYGATSYMATEAGQQKSKETSLRRYGVEYPSQSEIVRSKIQKTMIDRYGYATPSEVPKFNEARKQTFIKKYGVENPFMLDTVKEKIYKTFGSGGKVRTSKNQAELSRILGGELNKKIGKYTVDILLDDNIVVEYDGGGHDIDVQLNKITKDEFQKKEERRENSIIESGYKIIRFVNAHDRKFCDIDKIHSAINNCKTKLDDGYDIVKYDFTTNTIQ